jgi:hypothetical protein
VATTRGATLGRHIRVVYNTSYVVRLATCILRNHCRAVCHAACLSLMILVWGGRTPPGSRKCFISTAFDDVWKEKKKKKQKTVILGQFTKKIEI